MRRWPRVFVDSCGGAGVYWNGCGGFVPCRVGSPGGGSSPYLFMHGISNVQDPNFELDPDRLTRAQVCCHGCPGLHLFFGLLQSPAV